MAGSVALAVAFVTCPCHLPVTIPLVVGFLGGSAAAVVVGHVWLVWAASMLVFVLSLWVGLRWALAGDSPQAATASE